MSPVPLIVRVPFSSKFQVKLSPQVPEVASAASACNGSSGTIPTTIVRTNNTDRILLFIALILSFLSMFYGWRSWGQYSIRKGVLWGNFKNGKFRSKISNLSRKNHSLETRQHPLTMSRGCCFIMVAVYFFGRLRSWFFWYR